MSEFDNNNSNEEGAAGEEQIEGSYYDHIMTTKKYKDNEEMAKAIYHGDKHSKTVEGENARLRQWVAQFQPFIPILDDYMKSPEYAAKYGKTVTQGMQGNAEPEKKPTESKPDVTKEIVESMMGSKLGEYNARLTKVEVNNVLKAMREDKESFPYMTREVEDVMGKALSETNNSFPLDMKGLKRLYQAAVGEILPKILEKEKDSITKSNYANYSRKTGARTENDRDGNATGAGDEGDDIRQRIKSASKKLFS